MAGGDNPLFDQTAAHWRRCGGDSVACASIAVPLRRWRFATALMILAESPLEHKRGSESTSASLHTHPCTHASLHTHPYTHASLHTHILAHTHPSPLTQGSTRRKLESVNCPFDTSEHILKCVRLKSLSRVLLEETAGKHFWTYAFPQNLKP